MAIGPLSPRESPQPSTASRRPPHTHRHLLPTKQRSSREKGVCRQPRMNHDDVCRMRVPGTKHYVAACMYCCPIEQRRSRFAALAALPCYSRLVLVLSSCRPQRAVIHTMIGKKCTACSLVTTALSHTTSDARPTHGPIRHFLPVWHDAMYNLSQTAEQKSHVRTLRIVSRTQYRNQLSGVFPGGCSRRAPTGCRMLYRPPDLCCTQEGFFACTSENASARAEAERVSVWRPFRMAFLAPGRLSATLPLACCERACLLAAAAHFCRGVALWQ